MGILNTLKLSAILAVLVLAFQNCGSKGDFSGAAVAAADLEKSKKDLDQRVLSSGEFEVVSYTHSVCRSGTCTSASVVFKSKQTVEFKNSHLSGRAACNSFGGSYALTIRPNEGTNLIKIKSLVSTLMACSQLDEEQLLLQALTAAYKITDLAQNKVSIYTNSVDKKKSESGTLLLRRKVVIPEPVTSIVGSYKVIALTSTLCKADTKYYVDGPCVMQTTKFKSAQTIDFKKGGIVTGKAACNAFSGNYKFEDRPKETTELLSLSNLVSTEMACDNLKEEQALFAALSKVYKVEISSAQVQLLLPGGSVVLQKNK